MTGGNDIAVRTRRIFDECLINGYGGFDGNGLNLFHDLKDAVLGDGRIPITFGISELGRLLVVAHTEKKETIRIISARKATNGNSMKKGKEPDKENYGQNTNVPIFPMALYVENMQNVYANHQILSC